MYYYFWTWWSTGRAFLATDLKLCSVQVEAAESIPKERFSSWRKQAPKKSQVGRWKGLDEDVSDDQVVLKLI